MAAEVEVKFSETFPEELKPTTRERLSPFLHLLDRDLVTLNVAMKGSGDSQAGEASIVTKRRYHVAFIWFDPTFFGLEKEEQERVVVHEFMHVLLDGFTREVQHLIVHLVPDALTDYIEWRIEDAEEKVTDLLALALYDALRNRCRGCAGAHGVRDHSTSGTKNAALASFEGD